MTKNITNFIYEIFQLKHQKHSGWCMAGIKNPDSVAEHALIAAQLGFILAKMENANAEKVLTMLVFHDNAETRIGDLNKVNQRYFPHKFEAEKTALEEQVKNLPKTIAQGLIENFEALETKASPEAIIAKDADYLEQAFQACVYKSQGYTGVDDWINNVEKALQTKSAKQIFKQMLQTSPYEWFNGLKKL